MTSALEHNTAMRRARAGWKGLAWFAVLALCGTLLLRGANPPETSRRFLFVVETTTATARMADTLQRGLFEMIEGGLEGRMRASDTFGLWLSGDRVDVDYPMQTWDESQRLVLAYRATEHLKAQRFAKSTRLATALSAAATVVDSVKDLSIVLLTESGARVKGTPFDKEINDALKEAAPRLRSEKRPARIALQAEGGRLTRWSVDSFEAVPLPPKPVPTPKTPVASNTESTNRTAVATSKPSTNPTPSVELKKTVAAATNPAPVKASTAAAAKEPDAALALAAAGKPTEPGKPAPTAPAATNSASAGRVPDASANALATPTSAPAISNTVIATAASTNTPRVAVTNVPTIQAAATPNGGPPAEPQAAPAAVTNRRAPIILTRESVAQKPWTGFEPTSTQPATNPGTAGTVSNGMPANAAVRASGTNASVALTTNAAPALAASSSNAPTLLASTPTNLDSATRTNAVASLRASSNPIPAAVDSSPGKPVASEAQEESGSSNVSPVWLSIGTAAAALLAVAGLLLWRSRAAARRQPSLITQGIGRSRDGSAGF